MSGTGVVMEGVQFSDGHVAIRWVSEWPSNATFDSVEHLLRYHGHGGKSEIVWEDE